jgi:hypothetical protein
MEKSLEFVPVTAALLTETAVLLPLDIETDCGELLEPTVTVANERVEGLTVRVLVADAPAPESATACGLLVAVSVNVRVAARLPEAEGLNTILAEHEPAGEILVPQVLLEMEKSPEFVPVIAMLLMESSVLPPLDKETDCAELLEPTLTVAKESAAGLAVRVLVAAVPVPESVTVCGLPLAESSKLSVAVLLPVVVGAKTTFTVQLADAARLFPQVFEYISKSPGLAPTREMLPIVTSVELPFVSVTTF